MRRPLRKFPALRRRPPREALRGWGPQVWREALLSYASFRVSEAGKGKRERGEKKGKHTSVLLFVVLQRARRRRVRVRASRKGRGRAAPGGQLN